MIRCTAKKDLRLAVILGSPRGPSCMERQLKEVYLSKSCDEDSSSLTRIFVAYNIEERNILRRF